MSKRISIQYLNAAAVQLAHKILDAVAKHPELGNIDPVIIYGVPRGGVTVAYAVALAIKQADKNTLVKVTDNLEDADIIVDDLIDSGHTRNKYKEKAPGIPFFTLFQQPTEWLVFPWETQHSSADDIPIRLLQYIGEKANRGGLKETPERYLKAWKHFTSGYKEEPSDILKVFEDGAEEYNEMVLVKNIPVYSQCEHHLVPFFGVAHVAYIPNGKIVGLSKLNRLVNIFARRLQVQERLTSQVATALDENLKPKGVAVVLECRHLCMEARGVCQQGHTTVTSSMKGIFLESEPRNEFLSLIKE